MQGIVVHGQSQSGASSSVVGFSYRNPPSVDEVVDTREVSQAHDYLGTCLIYDPAGGTSYT